MSHRVLIVCASPVEGSEKHVAELAPGFDEVIAVDAGVGICRRATIAPDRLVGDLDSAQDPDVDWARELGAVVDVHPTDKDESDLELALRGADARGADHITITACTSGRLDHLLAVVGSATLPRKAVVEICEPDVVAWSLSGGGVCDLVLEGDGSTVSIIPIGGTATVSCEGVRWPLQSAQMDALSSWGLSNVIDIGRAQLRVHAGNVLVISPRVEGRPLAVRIR